MQKFLILGTETFAWNSSKRRELGKAHFLFTLYKLKMGEFLDTFGTFLSLCILSKGGNIDTPEIAAKWGNFGTYFRHFCPLASYQKVEILIAPKLLQNGGTNRK